MKLSLISLCSALLAAVLVSLPADSEAGGFDELHRRLDQLETAHRRPSASGTSARSRHPTDSIGGFPSSFGTVRMGRKGKGKVIKELLKKLKDYTKKKAEEERKKPDTQDIDEIMDQIISSTQDRDSNRDRDPIHRNGPFGRERKIPGTAGREIEGAFQGDTGKEVVQVGGGSDRDHGSDRNRGTIDRTGAYGREHKVRGSSGREIEGAVSGGPSRGSSSSSNSNRSSGSDRRDSRRDRDRSNSREGRSHRNRGDRGRSIEH